MTDNPSKPNTASKQNGARRAPAAARGAPGGQQGSVANAASQAVDRRVLRWRVPFIGFNVEVPKELVPFYAGLGAMTVLELIEWPVAVIVAVGHTIASGSRNQTIRELGEGVESGA